MLEIELPCTEKTMRKAKDGDSSKEPSPSTGKEVMKVSVLEHFKPYRRIWNLTAVVFYKLFTLFRLIVIVFSP